MRVKKDQAVPAALLKREPGCNENATVAAQYERKVGGNIENGVEL